MKTGKIAFLHFRLVDHNRELLPTGGLTVAYKLEEIASDPDYYMVELELAQCSKKDHYNRKIGNRVAVGRLEKNGGFVEALEKDNWFQELEGIVRLHYLPKTAQLVNTSSGFKSIG